MTHYTKFVQSKARGWSQWQIMGKTTHIACCDCGLVHSHQYRVLLHPRAKTATLYMRCRRHKGRTAARRKQYKHPCR